MDSWRKSTYSDAHGGQCVEVGTWRKSTYSDANGGACVEVASGDAVLVRDTVNRDGAVLAVAPAAWGRFVATLR